MSNVPRESAEYDLILQLLGGLLAGMEQNEIEVIFLAKLQKLRFQNSAIWKVFANKNPRLERMKRLAKRPHQ